MVVVFFGGDDDSVEEEEEVIDEIFEVDKESGVNFLVVVSEVTVDESEDEILVEEVAVLDSLLKLDFEGDFVPENELLLWEVLGGVLGELLDDLGRIDDETLILLTRKLGEWFLLLELDHGLRFLLFLFG